MTLKPWQRVLAAFAALGVASAALVLVAYSQTLTAEIIGESNMVYYWSASELVAAGDKAENATIRLGGTVVRGADEDWDRKIPLKFFVTDGQNTIAVESTGAPPQMFREGIGVLVEGHYANGLFKSGRVIVKHSNEYRVPESGTDMADIASTIQGG